LDRVYWTGEARGRNITTLIETRLQLLAVDQIADGDRNAPTIARTVTVAASPQRVAALAQAQATGRLTLSLVGAGDDTELAAIEVDQNQLLGIKERVKVENSGAAPHRVPRFLFGTNSGQVLPQVHIKEGLQASDSCNKIRNRTLSGQIGRQIQSNRDLRGRSHENEAENLSVTSGTTARNLSVAINRAVVVESDVPFAELSVANPAIADIATLSDRTIYVLGKSPGRTTLTLLGPDGPPMPALCCRAPCRVF